MKCSTCRQESTKVFCKDPICDDCYDQCYKDGDVVRSDSQAKEHWRLMKMDRKACRRLLARIDSMH